MRQKRNSLAFDLNLAFPHLFFFFLSAVTLLPDWPQGFTDSDSGEFEQHITIVPNPKSRRRGSMADYAFPELHGGSSGSGKAKKEPENILILTRTRTDRHGRRHSVAVPLVPPPDGERFEGGYHVERNPITGGAKLIPPSNGK